ncbi:MAG: hotdog fold thioesterase [Methanobacterium sp.]|uniref:PaaI family thioesterase n=1 Tax=Methanobacterium sp. TaxID=2164 RepID=UPI003D65E2BD|nr:hotdog fold thioesterase [Methanobacterium sp.]
MEHIKKFFKKDKFAENLGIKLIEVKEGYAKSKIEINENHLNGIGTAHGGAIFTLADFTFAVAANSYGTVTVAINANISFMKAAKTGYLIAEAKEIAKTPKLSTYTINVTDENDKLIAIFQGMSYTKRHKINLK